LSSCTTSSSQPHCTQQLPQSSANHAVLPTNSSPALRCTFQRCQPVQVPARAQSYLRCCGCGPSSPDLSSCRAMTRRRSASRSCGGALGWCRRALCCLGAAYAIIWTLGAALATNSWQQHCRWDIIMHRMRVLFAA
jgi:hypothetical protein